MKIASLALASTLAAIIGCAQPALAQSQDQTGATVGQGNGMNGQMMNGNNGAMNRGSMMNDQNQNAAGDQNDEQYEQGQTTGANNGESWSDNDQDNNGAGGNWNWHHRWRWSGNGPHGMGMNHHGHMGMAHGWMWRRHMMANAFGGARFHFQRGKSRIDVRCSAQEDMHACVQAATQLLDSIAKLHQKGDQGSTTGSGLGTGQGSGTGSSSGNNPGNSGSSASPSTPGTQSPSQRM